MTDTPTPDPIGEPDDRKPAVADAEEPIVDAELVDEHETGNLPASVADGEIAERPADVPATPEIDERIKHMIPVDDEWSDVDAGDLAPGQRRIPYMKLDRNVGGGFTDPDTFQLLTDLDFIWLAKGRSRVWFDKPFKAVDADPPSCRSFDGLHADPTSPALDSGWPDAPVNKSTGEKIVPTGDCSTCPLASFDDELRGGADVKRCRETVEALVSIPITDEPGAIRLVRLRWGGIAVRPTLDFWDSFFTRMPTKPPIAYVSHVELKAIPTDFGPKLAPEFTRVKQIPRSVATPLIVERDERVKAWLEDIADDVREGVDVAEDDDVAASPGAAGTPDYADEEPF